MVLSSESKLIFAISVLHCNAQCFFNRGGTIDHATKSTCAKRSHSFADCLPLKIDRRCAKKNHLLKLLVEIKNLINRNTPLIAGAGTSLAAFTMKGLALFGVCRRKAQ